MVQLLIALLLLLSAASASANHVVLITIDGFGAYLLNDPHAPIPTIRKLAREGASAEGMKVATPSVTWPNHTTLITGVLPEKHSVLFNGVLVRSGPDVQVVIDPKRDESELVAIPTLLELIHGAGMRTAAIDWPCTRNSKGVDDNFPDVPDQVSHTTPRLRSELVAKGILVDETDKSFQSTSAASHDQIWTQAACHVIRTQKPQLLLLHMLITDGIHHKYGPQTPAGYTAVALADAQLGHVLQALNDAGIRNQTTLFVVADHGFATATNVLQPNVILRKAGLLETNAASKLTKARVQSISEGGSAMIYLTNPETLQQDLEKTRRLFEGLEGIAEIVGPERFAEFGLPDPAKNPQMANLVLSAKPGYAFSNTAVGDDFVTAVIPGTTNPGYHGYLATNPKMNAVFVASGNRIKKGTKLGVINNTDVAPTIAHLLGQTLPGATGKVITEILEGQ